MMRSVLYGAGCHGEDKLLCVCVVLAGEVALPVGSRDLEEKCLDGERKVWVGERNGVTLAAAKGTW